MLDIELDTSDGYYQRKERQIIIIICIIVLLSLVLKIDPSWPSIQRENNGRIIDMRGHSVEKVMLSIPTSIKIEHNQRKRKIVVSIQNIDNETKCFCVHPHLSLVNVQWLKINTSLDLENQERKIISEIIEKNRHYAPTECWNGTASCNPDSWFEGTGGVMVQGKEFGFKEINITVPQNISQAPTGRWAFRMDVCEYRPRCIRHTLQKKSCSEWAGLCDNCQPSNCRYSVLIDECRSQSDDDCYILYDSQQFDVKLVEGGGVGD